MKTTLAAALALAVSAPLLAEEPRYSDVFDNVYKLEVDVSCQGKPRVTHLGAAYRYEDREGKSYFATVAHVINEEEKDCDVSITVGNKQERLEAKLQSMQAALDVAIMTTDRAKTLLATPKRVLFKDISPTDTVISIGFPMGEYRHVNKANVASTLARDTDGLAFIVLQGELPPGMSGGPVFLEKKGKLLYAGMITEQLSGRGGTLALPQEYIQQHIAMVEEFMRNPEKAK